MEICAALISAIVGCVIGFSLSTFFPRSSLSFNERLLVTILNAGPLMGLSVVCVRWKLHRSYPQMNTGEALWLAQGLCWLGFCILCLLVELLGVSVEPLGVLYMLGLFLVESALLVIGVSKLVWFGTDLSAWTDVVGCLMSSLVATSFFILTNLVPPFP